MKKGFWVVFMVITLITGCTQSRKKEFILNTLREKHQEIIKTFPEGWEEPFIIERFQLYNEQVGIGRDLKLSYKDKAHPRPVYMAGIIFSSNNGREEQVLCYTIGENNTELFLESSDLTKLEILNFLLSKEGTPQIFREYAETFGFDSFEMLIPPEK
jgi:hypothetical protein